MDAACVRLVREWSISHAYRADTFLIPSEGPKDADFSDI